MVRIVESLFCDAFGGMFPVAAAETGRTEEKNGDFDG